MALLMQGKRERNALFIGASREFEPGRNKTGSWGLNISRYLDTTQKEEAIDIPAAVHEFKELEARRNEVRRMLNSYLMALGYEV